MAKLKDKDGLSQEEQNAIVDRGMVAAMGILERLHQWLEGERVLIVGPFRLRWDDVGKPTATMIDPKPPAHHD